MIKKSYLQLAAILMVTILCFGFVSCGSDDNDGNGDSTFLIGEWQECRPTGEFKDDATSYEVMHLRFYSDGTGDWWSMSKGKKDSHYYSFNYSGYLNGSSGVLHLHITSSTKSSEIGKNETWGISYVNGILNIGEIYYKKK